VEFEGSKPFIHKTLAMIIPTRITAPHRAALRGGAMRQAELRLNNIVEAIGHAHEGLPPAQSRLESDANVPSMALTFLPTLCSGHRKRYQGLVQIGVELRGGYIATWPSGRTAR
jgi:hypothetical protein